MINPIVAAVPVFFASIGLEAFIAHRRGKHLYDLSDALTSLQLGVVSQVAGMIGKIASFGIYVAVYREYRAAAWPMDSAIAWIAALLLYDFLYYWYHRLGHEVGVMWASHVVHHSSEYYNLSTALRQTASGPLLGWMFYLPMAVLGVPPAMFATVAVIDLLYQYWVHTELVGKLGVLDRILVTPSNHRVHHGQNDYCIDRNYGGILIIWDRMFGSFAEERDDERICYGIRTPLRSFNPIWGNLHFYADLWAKSRAAPDLAQALGVWLAPPGGWHDAPLAHFDPAGFKRFAVALPGGVMPLALLNYVIGNVMLILFLTGFERFGAWQIAIYSMVIGGAALGTGGLLQSAAWARGFEMARLAAMAALWLALPGWCGFALPYAVACALALVHAGAFLWLARLAPATGGLAAS